MRTASRRCEAMKEDAMEEAMKAAIEAAMKVVRAYCEQPEQPIGTRLICSIDHTQRHVVIGTNDAVDGRIGKEERSGQLPGLAA